MAITITEANNLLVYRTGSSAGSAALSRIRGNFPMPNYTAVGAVSAVSWSDGGAGGAFLVSGTNNVNAVYRPANRTQAVTIAAQDTSGIYYRTLTVEGTQPLHPTIGFEKSLDVETKVSNSRAKVPYFKEIGQRELAWIFWRAHRKVVPFWCVDAESQLINKVRFTSEIKSIPEGANRWNIAASVRGLDEAAAYGSEAAYALRNNSGGPEVGEFKSDNYFRNGTSFSYGNITVDTSGLLDPAPEAVYRDVHFDSGSVGHLDFYAAAVLRPLTRFVVRLHFYSYGVDRTVTPIIQGITYPNVATPNSVAVIADYGAVYSDSFGGIAIQLDLVSGPNAALAGVEILEQMPGYASPLILDGGVPGLAGNIIDGGEL
jgi:hypothetical protein